MLTSCCIKEGRRKATKTEKEDDESLTVLPNDLLMDILSRLPLKSLLRFRSVSKVWLTLFNNPCFAKMHLSRSQRRKLVLSCWDDLILHSGDIDHEPRQIDINVQVHDRMPEWVSLFGSCDGLVLLAVYVDYMSHLLCLINPSTGKMKKLPDPPFQFQRQSADDSYGFGYDVSIDDYKIVQITMSCKGNCWRKKSFLYSLKTNCWRRIGDSPYRVMKSKAATLLNGVLHWLTHDKSKIVSLDLAKEKFGDVLLPELKTRPFVSYCELGVLRGCLCISTTWDITHKYCSEFWVMQEYGNRESWTKVTFAVPNHLLKPLDFSDNDENLFVDDKRQLVMCNLQENTYRYLKVPNTPPWNEAETYLESIVSPILI